MLVTDENIKLNLCEGGIWIFNTHFIFSRITWGYGVLCSLCVISLMLQKPTSFHGFSVFKGLRPVLEGFNHDYNMHLKCRPVNIQIRVLCSKREPFRVLLPLLRHAVPINNGNCHLTIPIVMGRCDGGALPHAFHIGVFKFVKTIFTKIKHIYKESANIIEGCNVTFDTNDCWNFQ